MLGLELSKISFDIWCEYYGGCLLNMLFWNSMNVVKFFYDGVVVWFN